MKNIRFGLMVVAAALGASAFTLPTPEKDRFAEYKWLDLSSNTFVEGGALMTQQEAHDLYFPTCNGGAANCARAYSATNVPQNIYIQRQN